MEEPRQSPVNAAEVSRLKELHNLNILDTGKEERFERYTRLVADIFDMPVVLITLIDLNRQWFKSCFGVSIDETPRSISFCTHTIKEKQILVIPDAAKDERFSKNPLVIGGPMVRFYAGAVLRGPTGEALGTLCILDQKPRSLNEQEKDRLIQFACLVEHELTYNHHINEMRAKVENSLYYDSLTGLPNRRLLNEKLQDAIETIEENQKIAIISIGLNRFRELKNSSSAETADFIINEVSKRLRKNIEKSGVVCRWGDDYFVIFMSIKTKSPSLLTQVENMIGSLGAAYLRGEEKHLLSCEVGISLFPDDSHDPNQLISNAIYAMRLKSPDTKVPFRFYAEESTRKISKQYELEKRLIQAVEANQLELVYQPKVDIVSKKICGIEALSRWTDSIHGPILPEEFIPIAERSNLIIKLGEWVLRKACEQNKKWQMQGFQKLPISVNISQKQITKMNFDKDIQRILKETDLDPLFLDLEVTESSLIDMEAALQNINAICKLGISFSLDDFGTGFSSLSYLQKLPLKTLKIDKSFIENMLSNKSNAVMVQTIIALSKTLNLICVAEGVETPEQEALLKEYRCDQIQGFLFSKPLTENAFKKLLSKDIPKASEF